jgi:pectate lyase
MKTKLLYLILLLASIHISAQQITITESTAWLESAFVKWTPLTGTDSYNVYYTGGGQTNKKIDNELIRNYGSYFRADIPGLAAGNYTITVKPVTATVEGTGTTTSGLTVLAQDRNGFAFDGGRVPGGYNIDGTPKTGAVILYITQNTKNTISSNITGASANPCIGLQNILYGIKKGKDTRPFIIRLIGNITDMTVMEGGDITIENANNASSYLTIEGIGNDAVVNGMGIRLKSASNIEVSNLGFMNCNSTAGDNVGLQDKNDHVWVHNCDLFYGDAGSDADQIKGDGAMDNKGSTYVTFSYNHFWDSGKSSLLGLSEGTTTGLYLTYHHNWFDHSDSRHPRVRYYSAHIYNNYFDGNSKYGSGATLGSSLFVESNYYRNSKHPMMISLQGTDVWDEANQKNNPGTLGTFSGEAGGSIKAFNNTFDADIATNNMRFVAYGDTNPLYNISGKISSTTDFDAFVVTNREDLVPATVKSFSGANVYNNFDNNASLYVKNLVVEQPAVAKAKVIQYSGRVSGGDLKWTFNNAVDDASASVITALKTTLTNYTSTLVAVQGETPAVVSSQTLSTDTDNNQTVSASTAIEPMIFTWGGDATDATVTGIPASGITFVKDISNKKITITGTPTASVSYSIATTGASGTPAKANGTITLEGTITPPPGDQIHDFTVSGKTSTFYTITGNLATNKGTVTYNNLTLTQCLKMETATTITYTTTQASTLTLVFVEAAGTAKIDGTNYTATSGIITVSIPAGNHTIAKKDTANLFYIKTAYSGNLGLGQNFDSNKLILYPNPVTNQISISAENIQKIEIYTILGTLVKTVEKNTESIDLSNLNSGNYIVRITTDQGSIIKKIIKK